MSTPLHPHRFFRSLALPAARTPRAMQGAYRRWPLLLLERCGCIMGIAAAQPLTPYCGAPRGPELELSCVGWWMRVQR